MTADDQPTLVLPPEEEHPRRSRGRAWVVVLLVVIVLVGSAAVAAEWLARGAVAAGVRQLVVAQLDVPADHPVEVETQGLVVPQLISGRLDQVSASSPDLPLGRATGDVSVTLRDVPIRADAPAGGGLVAVRMDESQLRALLSTVEGFPAEDVALSAPEVVVASELSAFGVSVPVSVALLPGATDGALTLAPQRLTVSGAEMPVDELRARFGGLVDPLTRTWEICVAQDIPAALTLTSATVEGSEVVATFDIDGRVVVDPALRARGTCN